MKNYYVSIVLLVLSGWVYSLGVAFAQSSYFFPGQLWFDTDGRIINAHGGGVLQRGDTYYWYGEHKGEHTNDAEVGVTCYSSQDLHHWKFEGIALSVSGEAGHPIEKGCIIERPKVIYCQKTQQYVMYFHLELKGKGYAAAHAGVAVSDTPTGPFKFIKHGRVNAGCWPEGTSEIDKQRQYNLKQEWWTEPWRADIKAGMFVSRDMKSGQMARDQQLFVDADGKAYHIYSSEDNLTLHIAELTDDYLDYTGRYVRVDPAGHNEAPAIFRHEGRYYMITSGCTGWKPNAARLFTADNIMGPWVRHDNPCEGKGAETTFRSQSTFILPYQDGYIFMADRWMPHNPIDGRYVWLPIEWKDGLPVLRWKDRW